MDKTETIVQLKKLLASKKAADLVTTQVGMPYSYYDETIAA